MDSRFRFTRLARTLSSEVYIIWEEENRVGQLDLHYTPVKVYATMVLEADLSVTSEQELLMQIDEQIVASHLPAYERDDFLVTVYRGEEISSYTDPGMEADEDEE